MCRATPPSPTREGSSSSPPFTPAQAPSSLHCSPALLHGPSLQPLTDSGSEPLARARGLAQTPPTEGKVSGGVRGLRLAVIPGRGQGGVGLRQCRCPALVTQLQLSPLLSRGRFLSAPALNQEPGMDNLCPPCPQPTHKRTNLHHYRSNALPTGHWPLTGQTAMTSKGLLPSCPPTA